ncbi:MAG: disaggregatase related repeat-containing protein, partial [Planctomycetota bacterium]
MLKFTSQHFVVWVLSVLISATAAFGARNDWAEGAPARSTGATRDYYNSAGKLAWKNFMGDWHDAKDVAQGATAYSTTNVVDDDKGKFVDWSVTNLVREWQGGRHKNQGFFLRTTGSGGTIVFCSREYADAEHRPRLIIVGENGARKLGTQADTYLTKSTYRSQGHTEELRVSGAADNLLIRFDLAPAKKLGQLSKATLRLYTTRQYGTAEIGVFRCKQGHDLPPSDPIPGLASRYPGDKGIGKNPDVVFATDFESQQWSDEWTYAGKMEVIDTVSEDVERKFEPLQGKALRVKIAKGSTGALNTLFKFKRETGTEPEEIHF